jgi:hypothetical protein
MEMKKPTSAKAARGAKAKGRNGDVIPPGPRAHAIRIPDKPARLRAIMALGEVGVPYCCVPDPEGGVLYLVTNKHLETLQGEGIPFEIV